MMTALNADGTQFSAQTAPPPTCDAAPSPVPTPGDVRGDDPMQATAFAILAGTETPLFPAGHAKRNQWWADYKGTLYAPKTPLERTERPQEGR